MARQERELEQRLYRAETGLARAVRRVATLRRRAMYGDYDPQMFGSAIEAYEVAEAEVREARAVLVHFLSTQPGDRSCPHMERTFDTGASGDDEESDPDEEPVNAVRKGVDRTSLQEAEPAAVPATPTPRLEFVRWLVQTGRLSDN